MKRHLCALLLSAICALPASAAEPLRVFIRAGAKSHGPGAHDFPQFLKDWVPMLNERGAKAEGGLEFPTKEQLDRTDVLILHAQEAGNIKIGEERKNLMEFLQRGGGLVVIHAAAVSRDHDWFKTIIGGSWKFGQTKWLEAPLSLYFTDRENPITRHISNFDLDDEIYYDMDLLPEVNVLAAAYTPKAIDTGGKGNKEAQERAADAVAKKKGVNIYDIQPQVWTYEVEATPSSLNSGAGGASPPENRGGGASDTGKSDEGVASTYRAFTCIPGHWYKNFSHNGLRTMILRGIAWAGKRENVDELCKPEELGDALRYVEGGAPRPQDVPKDLEVHPEFEISLVASEPLINNPMNIDWDEKGRLWVVETPEYPNGLRQANVESWMDSGSLKPGQYDREPQDRISILEDTDGDGVMDKKTVFADKIELATSSVFYKNGVIVCAAPDIWFFEDTNGDDKADKRTKLYTNLGIRDTHAVINNMRWGLDGWIYATHGYSSSDNVQALGPRGDGVLEYGSDGKAKTPPLQNSTTPASIGSGVIRFRPDGTKIEQYSSRGGNTWGLDITWDGQVFYTQPTSGVLFHHVVLPEYVLAKGKLPGVTSSNGLLAREPTYPAMHWEQQAYVQIDQVGSYTAAAGCAIYEGGAWPEKWNYGYFTTEPTLNIVSHFMVEPDGVTFKAKREPGREQTEFIRSKNLWFRPIEVRVGPDGALYVVDFCNQAVIHNDTRGPTHGPANAAVRPDRDHYYGRIWKVQHKEARKVVKMEGEDLKSLIQTAALAESKHQRAQAWIKVITEFPQEKVFETHNALGLEMLDNKSPVDDRLKVHKLIFTEDGKIALGAAFVSVMSGREKIPGEENLDRSHTEMIRQHLEAAGPAPRPREIIGLSGMVDAKVRAGLLKLYPRLEDDWSRSAVISVLSDQSADAVIDCLKTDSSESVASLVAALLPSPNTLKDPAKLLTACANADAKADPVKNAILRGIATGLNETPDLSPALTEALKKLLAQPALAAATLPLVTKWDKGGALAAEVKKVESELVADFLRSELSVDIRGAAARALIQIGSSEVNEIAALLSSNLPDGLKIGVLNDLCEFGGSKGAKAAADAFQHFTRNPALTTSALDSILKRPEATRALLDAVKAGSIDRTAFSPGDVARLRSHPNKPLARRANELFQVNNAAKAAIIAKLTPEVEKPGNAENGKLLYSAACAVCHKLGDLGMAVGPPLDGMGAHGPAELLIHIVDPNREVDPSFWAFNISTKKGELLQGVITSENSATVTLATQAGVREIAKSDIEKRENTGRSLMPEGLDGLGAEALRDILTFICGEASKQFRIISLAEAATASSSEGVFAGPAPNQGQVRLKKFGDFKVEGVPFFIPSPEKATGGNFIVLKGGPNPDNHSQTFPARVELALNVETKKLQLLSGISGWGWPAVRDEAPALKATVVYASGEKEEFTFINGVHFSDYIRPVEVPGSRYVEGITDGQQMRLLTLELTKKGPAKTLILESPAGNKTAPVIAAVTADIEGRAGVPPATSGPGILPGKAKGPGKKKAGKMPATPESGGTPELQPKTGGQGDGPLVPASAPQWEAGKTKVLVIGGGSSHNFKDFFGTTDVATLKAAGFSVHYTEDRDQAATELSNADVAVISVNRKFFDTAAYRKALFDFAAAGKGIIMLHPGTWYGYANWPELNAQIVGGGARGHDKIHPFDVKKLKDHPIMEGVPASFTVEDELYYVNAEPEKIPAGTASIEVLAETSPSDKFQKPHPSVWITRHPQARIVGIALGHDERTHDHPAFRQLLANAVRWGAGK